MSWWTGTNWCRMRGATKASKTITTTFFPVGDDFEAIAAAWVAFLRQECQRDLDDPLFPATRIAVGPRGTFEPAGLDRKCWSTAAPIRTIFRNAFENAGLRYVNPQLHRPPRRRRPCKTSRGNSPYSPAVRRMHERAKPQVRSGGYSVAIQTTRKRRARREVCKSV
ncbi:hypothetical protein [Ancylobacter sp.]|uniref:hypothetical protein n=1 Tax=Ancylobacter sp. TaxID=1872567 RepID=UPI003C7A69AE